MAITSGFYNALNHDRQYEATQIGSIFDGIIEDGIYETIGQKFMVTASGNGLVVNVGTGRAWFDHTWTLNDAILPIEMDEAELVLDRIDAVVLEVDASLSGRTNAVKTVKGTPSSQPVKPTLINTEEVHQYPLAYVSIRAEQTLIEQSDIENAVGTSATPFVVGVLEMMDVDALVAQWQTQFENMMRDDQQDFTNWEILVKASYEAWFAGVQAQMEEDIDEFETWESTTKTTFDAWFQNLQDELDDNQAAHLQRQIGNLNALDTSAKSDLVSAINEVNGRITTSISEILIDYDESMVGVEVTLSHTASAEGHTPESYTRTLTEPEPGMPYEIEVDVKNLGEWVISWTHEGESYTQTLDVHYYGYYHVVLHEGFTWREWVVAGGISILKHDSLASLLADEKDVRQLFTKHASVDYMVDKETANSTECQTIINNDICAKWINLNDYALDKLYTNVGIESLMDTADKYGYGEWVYDGTSWGPKGNVPVMTSATAPYGEVSAIGNYSGAEAYRAFDGNDATEWHATAETTNVYLAYKSVNPIKCSKVKAIIKFAGAIPARTIKIQGSNDGSTWDDIGTIETEQTTSQITKTYEIDTISSTYYLHHRIFSAEKLHQASVWSVQFITLQFYGRELKVSVPTMTSNTAPYGEVVNQNVASNMGWQVFSGDNTKDTQLQNLSAGARVGYKFGKDTVVKFATIVNLNGANAARSPKTYKFQSANDASEWTDLTETITNNVTTQNALVFAGEINENNIVGKYCAVCILSGQSSYPNEVHFGQIRFYGKDYSEKEFANDGSKWLYDHGVELEEFIYNAVGSGSISKSENGEIYIEVLASTQRAASALTGVNLTDYSVLRAVAGDRFYEKPQLSVSPNSTPSYAGTAFDAYYVLDPPIDKYNLSLSVVSINGDKYVGIYAGNNTGTRNNRGTISEFWLE